MSVTAEGRSEIRTRFTFFYVNGVRSVMEKKIFSLSSHWKLVLKNKVKKKIQGNCIVSVY